MLRAGVNNPERPLIVCGLSEGNVMRLKDGKPIHAELKTFGVNLPGALAIFYGVTEADLERQLREIGVIGENTRGYTEAKVDQETEARARHEHVLIALVGLPRSGKTTWARSQSYPVVNPDSIRLALHGQRFSERAEPFVWATAKVMVRALFLAGHRTVILDATNTTRKRRDEWRSKEWGLFFKPIPTPAEECRARCVPGQDDDLLPVIERMAASFEPLTDDEQLWP